MTAGWQMPLYSELISKSWKDIVIYQYHTISSPPYLHYSIPRRDIIDKDFFIDLKMLAIYLRSSHAVNHDGFPRDDVVYINFECMIKFIEAKNIVIHLVDLEKK